MKRGLLYLFSILLVIAINTIAFRVSGQVINGKVTDEKGNPLPGAAIAVENTYLGTYSGSDGTYFLKISKDGVYSLKFSFTGYEGVNRAVNLKGISTQNVTLVPRK